MPHEILVHECDEDARGRGKKIRQLHILSKNPEIEYTLFNFFTVSFY